MDLNLIIKAGGFLLVLGAQLVVVSRLVSKMSFKVEAAAETDRRIEAKVDKLTENLFPDGRAVFVYKGECRDCHGEIFDLIRQEIGELKDEFKKRDNVGQDAHATLHRRIDDLTKDLYILQSDAGKRNV